VVYVLCPRLKYGCIRMVRVITSQWHQVTTDGWLPPCHTRGAKKIHGYYLKGRRNIWQMNVDCLALGVSILWFQVLFDGNAGSTNWGIKIQY